MNDDTPTLDNRGFSRRKLASVLAPPEVWRGNEDTRYARVHPADLEEARARVPHLFEAPYELHASGLCPRGRVFVVNHLLALP